MTTQWFHRCCDHGAADIAASGFVTKPQYQPVLGTAANWWAFDRGASAAALGLGGHDLVACDRMAHLFAAVPDDLGLIVPWHLVRDRFQMGLYLEGAKGTRPTLWGISFEPIRVEAL